MGDSWWLSWPSFTHAMEDEDIPAAATSLENSKWYTEVGIRAVDDLKLIES
jgi:hypothetical protein